MSQDILVPVCCLSLSSSCALPNDSQSALFFQHSQTQWEGNRYFINLFIHLLLFIHIFYNEVTSLAVHTVGYNLPAPVTKEHLERVLAKSLSQLHSCNVVNWSGCHRRKDGSPSYLESYWISVYTLWGFLRIPCITI